MKVTHSCISEKLFKVNLDFSCQAYECIYKEFSKLYTKDEREKLGLIRVDSTMVMEAGTRPAARNACRPEQGKCTGYSEKTYKILHGL